ncbi:MAG: hypothetical protein ACXWLM_11815 [Myxococcales bacterium]
MYLLDKQMPSFRLRQVDRIALAAAPDEVWPVVRAFDLYEMPFARGLFALRLLPENLLARLRGRPVAPAPRHARIEQFTAPGTGWMVLGERRREVAIGFVGRFWTPQIETVLIEPAQFAEFERPGVGKVAWSLRVDPREGGGSWVTIDVRVLTDAPSWPKFQRYWKLIGPFSHRIRRAYLRGLRRRFGPPQSRRKLPGDEQLREVRYEKTHLALIEAPPVKVWPWLVQMGCQRAGWYAIDRLDNAGVPSADRIVPALQHIEVGDILPATPKGPEGFAVLRVDRGRALVLGSPSLLRDGREYAWGAPWTMTWAFVLEPVGDDATLLRVRVRGEYQPALKLVPMVAGWTALHDVMETAQLRHIKQRAEAAG